MTEDDLQILRDLFHKENKNAVIDRVKNFNPSDLCDLLLKALDDLDTRESETFEAAELGQSLLEANRDLEKEKEELNTRISELEKAIEQPNSYMYISSDNQGGTARLEAECTSLKERVRQFREEKNELQSEVLQLRDANNTHKQELQVKQMELEREKRRIHDVNQYMSHMQESLEKSQREKKSVEKDLQHYRAKLREEQERNRNEKAVLEKRIEEQKESKANLEMKRFQEYHEKEVLSSHSIQKPKSPSKVEHSNNQNSLCNILLGKQHLISKCSTVKRELIDVKTSCANDLAKMLDYVYSFQDAFKQISYNLLRMEQQLAQSKVSVASLVYEKENNLHKHLKECGGEFDYSIEHWFKNIKGNNRYITFSIKSISCYCKAKDKEENKTPEWRYSLEGARFVKNEGDCFRICLSPKKELKLTPITEGTVINWPTEIQELLLTINGSV
eukprot:gb/GECH01006113.1/.p1 GENE.gb/GECH01006113.1/~~gb/GECH01006113.1/.p1  ORF type:complete len:446 (+),score=95.70 gb/GECH01006113.1/:1-1338(+)